MQIFEERPVVPIARCDDSERHSSPPTVPRTTSGDGDACRAAHLLLVPFRIQHGTGAAYRAPPCRRLSWDDGEADFAICNGEPTVLVLKVTILNLTQNVLYA